MADVESYDDGPGRLPNKAHKLLFGNEENVQEMIRKGSIVEEEKVSTTNSMKKAFRSSMAKSFRRTKRATSTASTMTSATRSSYESGDSNWTNPLGTPGTANFSSFSTRQSIVSPITPSSRKDSNVGFNHHHHHHPQPPNFIDPFTQQLITNSPDPIISNSNNRQTRKFSSITPEPNLLEILTSTGNGGSTTSVNSISSKRNAPPPSAYRTRLASVPVESNRMNEKSNRSSNTAYRQSSMMTQQPLLPQQQELQQQQVPDTATLQQPLLRPLLLAQQYQSKENKETNLKGEKGLDDNPPLPPPKKDDPLDENNSSSKGFATRKPWERPLRVPPRLDLSDLSNISNGLMISALGNNNQQQTHSNQSPKSLTFSQSQKGKMTQDLGGLDSPTVPEESVRDSLLPYMKNGSYNSSIESKSPFSPLSVIRSSSIKNFIAPLSPSSKNKFSTEKSLRDEIERGSITVSHPIHLSNNHGTNDNINDEKIENQLFPGSPNDADSILDGECPSPSGSSSSPSLIENSERLSDLFPIPHKRSSQTDSNGKSTSKHSPSLETVESESEHSQEQEEGEQEDECFMFDKEIQEEQNQQIIISPPPTITRNGERMSIELIENILSPLPPNPHPSQSSSQSSILSLSNDYESAKSFIREDSIGSGSNRSSNTMHSSGTSITNNSHGITQNETLRKVRSGSLSTMERPSFTSTPLPPPPTNTFIEENKKQNRILGIRDSKVPMNVNNINPPTPNNNRFSKSIMNQQSIKNLTSLRNLSVPSPSTSCQSSSDIELGKLIGLPGISTNNSKSSLSKNTTKEFENEENNNNGNGNSLFSSLTTKRSFFSSKPKRKSNACLNGGNTPMTASSLTSKLIDQSTLSMNHNSASNNTKTRKRRSTITASIPPSPFTVPVDKSRWKNNRPESIDLTLGDDEDEIQEAEVDANTNALTDEVLISDLVDNIIGGMENGGIKSIDNISHSQSLPPSTEENNQEDEMENLSGDPMASHFSYDSDLDHPTMNGGGNNNHSSSSTTTGGTSIRKPLKGLLRSVKSVAAFNE